MDTLHAIETRTSTSIMTEEAPAREDIERVLEAAVHAPNHHLTEPWRFTVFAGDARAELGEALASVAASTGAEETAQEKARRKPFRAPVVILVTAKAGRDEIETLENRHAVAAAVQNMLLAAHAMGLATIWRTGDPIYSEQVRELVGAGDGEIVIAAVYLGYAKRAPKPRRRSPVGSFTVWRGA